MSFRTVVIKQPCKLSTKNNFLIVRAEEVTMIHLSEIGTIVVENLISSITTQLLCELSKQNIKLVVCDEKHNPTSELVSLHTAFDASRKVLQQAKWNEERMQKLWSYIVAEKIFQQAENLKRVKEHEREQKLRDYITQIELGDPTNREGHAAKVYFNGMFGLDFTRDIKSNINVHLDYGYSILLSAFNRAVVAKGYITQIGLCHKSLYNYFNLSCDLMEPFRPIVDLFVHQNLEKINKSESLKVELVDLLNKSFKYNGKEQYLENLIGLYVQDVVDYLNGENLDLSRLRWYEV